MTRKRRGRTVDLGLDRRDDVVRAVDDEITLHIELLVERLIARGHPPEEARAIALERFGPMDEARNQLIMTASAGARHMRFADHLESIRQDVAYSIRQLRRSPSFAAAVVITLGLGIGANATMFGAIDQLLLRPPEHVREPSRLMTVALRDTRRDATHLQRVLSYPIYQDLQRATDAFERVGLYRGGNIDFGSGAQVKPLGGILATASYFSALGASPVAGRFFTGDEAGDAPGAAVAVLGYGFWQREFNGDRSIVGQAIKLAGVPHTVVGIAPEGFTGVGLTRVDVWIPLTDGMSAATVASIARQRQTYSYSMVGRLVPGITTQRASEIATAAVSVGARNEGATEAQLRALGRRIELTSVLPRDARGDTPESRVAELLGAVSLFVLLLACANVMNLQLARGIRRRREIAVRIALGVSRGRLIRQLALDCVLLAMAGGVAGLIVARFGGRFVRETLFGGSLGSISPVDAHVLTFSLIAVVITGLLTGLVPAGEMLRTDVLTSLKEGSRSGESTRTGRLRAILLATQAALTTVLLVGTGLFVLSLRRIDAVPLGFDPSHAAMARLNISGRRMPPFADETEAERVQTRTTFRRLEEAARETPGVTAVALALTAPFEGGYAGGLKIPGRDSTPVTREGGPYYNAVSADYFVAIGSRIVAGRAFTASDHATAPHVVIVNETAARLWWPGEGAVGKCVYLEKNDPCAEVVGVVQNTHRLKIVEDDFVQFFAPIDQTDPLTPSVVIVRTAGRPEDVIPGVQRRLQVAVPGLPSITVRPLEALIAPKLRSWKLGAVMFSVFGCLALALAAIGLYSVLAYDVAQRRQELGVRRALGAAARNIAGMVIRRGLVTVGGGLVVGVAIALLARRMVEPLLFQTSPSEPTIYIGVALVLATISIVATALPAWRASRVDPSLALRGE